MQRPCGFRAQVLPRLTSKSLDGDLRNENPDSGKEEDEVVRSDSDSSTQGDSDDEVHPGQRQVVRGGSSGCSTSSSVGGSLRGKSRYLFY